MCLQRTSDPAEGPTEARRDALVILVKVLDHLGQLPELAEPSTMAGVEPAFDTLRQICEAIARGIACPAARS